MDKELKAKWVEALRSGEYQQCVGTLHDGVGYCCMGVLLEVAGMNRDHPHTLTASQEKRVGLWGEPYHNARLECMNDGKGDFVGNRHTFAEIADWIEANL